MESQNRRLPIAVAAGLVLTLVLLSLLVSRTSPVALAQSGTGIIRVVPAGTDAPGCGRETSPCRTIQYAVDQALSNEEIRVASGTYTGVQNIPSLNTSVFTATQVVAITKDITIRGGYTTSDWGTPNPEANQSILDAQGQGRVIYVTGDISPTIEGLHITGGDAAGLGGGLETPTGAFDAGGGLYVRTAGGFIANNWVLSNRADNGGGLYLGGSDATLHANTIASNTGQWGGGVYVKSGGPILTENLISSNTGTIDGGGLNIQSGATVLNGNTVVSNVATFGGGAFLVSGDPTLTGNTFLSNTAANAGGGLWLHSSPATLVNNVVARNQTSGRGSGLFIGSSSPRLLHNTIADNSGGDGTGLHVTDQYYGGPSSVDLTNTVLVGHNVGVIVTEDNWASLDGVLWYGNSDANTGGTGTIAVSNAVTGDPVFVDAASGDYHVDSPSAAIDAGVSTGVYTDIDGDARPQGSGFDLGADEFIPATLAINYTRGKPGSFFSLTGSNFPPNGMASVIINGTTLTDTLEVDNSGNVAFLLDTSQADAGRYIVTVTSNPSAVASFTLDPSYPLRPQEGTGTLLEVPSGIALTNFVYLPLVQR